MTHLPGVYVPLRALLLVVLIKVEVIAMDIHNMNLWRMNRIILK